MSLSSTTRASGNATGLPAGSLSRRSALCGSAAVAIVLAAGVTPAQPATAAPDAVLIELARSLEALMASEREAWDRHSAAEDAAFKESPPAPTRREVKGPYAGLEGLPPEQHYAKLFADPVEFWATSKAADAEHHDAMAEHAQTVAAIEKRHGVSRLERRARRLSDEVTASSDRLAEMRAETPAGVAAKAYVLLPVTGADSISCLAELERHLALLNSILEDAARIGMRRLS